MASSSGNGRPDVEPMGTGLSLLITAGTWLVPTIALALIGAGIGTAVGLRTGIIVMLVLVWTGLFTGAGFFKVNQQEWKVMERFGKFHSVKLSGLRWKNFIFDNERASGTLTARPHNLYENNQEAEIDFTDITARIVAVAYYSIVDPAISGGGDVPEMKRQIARWVYCYDEPYDRVADIIDGELRPVIQREHHEEVQKNGEKLCEIAIDNSRESMKELGAYPAPGNALIIKDIIVPDEIQTSRERAFVDAANAAGEKHRLAAPARAILAIKEELGASCTDAFAWDVLREKMRLEALSSTGANVTLYGESLGDLLRSVSGVKGS